MKKWENARVFVELAFSIDQYFSGYVDAYYGPQEIPQNLDRRGKIPLKEIEQIALALLNSTSQDDSLSAARKEFLEGEVKAMLTTTRLLQGETLDFIDEVQSLYGVTPTWIDEATFDEAHKALNDLLPGTGPLEDRMKEFRERCKITTEQATPSIYRLSDNLQARTRERFNLPAGESCKFEFVKDKPWGAYNWYLGNYQSRIDFNLDSPLHVYNLLHFITHEAYPGHHTEHSIKEQKLYRENDLLEYSILLSNTPAAVISEGIAECALELIFSPEELVKIYQQIIEETGMSGYDGQLVYEYFHVAMEPLINVGDNKLLLLHERGASDDEVIAYGRRYGLSSDKETRRYLKFAKDPLWRSYGYNYTLGLKIISKALSTTENKEKMFARLLQEPMTPAQVQHLALQ